MRCSIILLLVIGRFFCEGQVMPPATPGTLAATALKPLGRTRINERGNLELIGTAAHVGFRFTGARCAVYAFVPDDGTIGYLNYEVDGKYVARVRLSDKPDSPVVIATAKAGTHTVWVYKTTEALSGPVEIMRITGQSVSPVAVSAAPLVEFIGNSITSGAASDSSSYPCGIGNYHEHTNGYMAYGPRVARLLGLNYIVNSVSGIGIYRTWNLDTPSMPAVYENLRLRTADSLHWDFSTYSPAIVSIALGTNDLSGGDKVHPRPAFDTAVFIHRYVTFVQLIKSKYPGARIALLSSPMIAGDRDSVFRYCLLSVKRQTDENYPNDKPVACFFFTAMLPHGCIGHPSVSDHAVMADQLKPFFQKLLQ